MIFHDFNKYSFFLANFHFKANFPLITAKKEGFTFLRRKIYAYGNQIIPLGSISLDVKVLIKIFKFVAKVPAMRHTCPYWQICSWVTLTPIISQVVAISKTKDKMVVIIPEVGEGLTIEREAFVFA